MGVCTSLLNSNKPHNVEIFINREKKFSLYAPENKKIKSILKSNCSGILLKDADFQINMLNDKLNVTITNIEDYRKETRLKGTLAKSLLQMTLSEAFKEREKPYRLNFDYVGLNVPKLYKEEYYKSKIFGMPVYHRDKLEIRCIDKENGSRTSNTFDFVENKSLRVFTNFSGVCNAKDCLYISGGDFEGVSQANAEIPNGQSKFIKVNLTDFSLTELPELLKPRLGHTMVYLPEWYIYIIGGNHLETEIYDIRDKKLTPDSKLNVERSEPAVCLVNESLLYAFCGYNKTGYLNSIEKCNIRTIEKKWTLVDLKININPGVYSVAFNSDLIYLMGGDCRKDKDSKICDYEINFDTMVVKEIKSHKSHKTFEKLFTPVDKTSSYLFSLFYEDEMNSMVIFEHGQVRKMKSI
jgi:hypothetical protein